MIANDGEERTVGCRRYMVGKTLCSAALTGALLLVNPAIAAEPTTALATQIKPPPEQNDEADEDEQSAKKEPEGDPRGAQHRVHEEEEVDPSDDPRGAQHPTHEEEIDPENDPRGAQHPPKNPG